MNIAESIIARIRVLPRPRLIGVSGFGGSGKSTFAKALGHVINAPVVSIDSFQKDALRDTPYRLWEMMDFARLEEEVLKPFPQTTDQLIVEGVGLFRPELSKYWAFKVWMDCPLETAILRGKKRDREEHKNPKDEYWDGIWKDNDLQYLETFRPKEAADLLVPN